MILFIKNSFYGFAIVIGTFRRSQSGRTGQIQHTIGV